MSALDLVALLPQVLPELRALTFITYAPSPGWTQRVRALSAAERRQKPQRVLREAMRHDTSTEQSITVPCSRMSRDRLEKLAEAAPPGHVLAIRSLCKSTRRGEHHIPMMDMKVRPSVTNLKRVLAGLRTIGCTQGVVLASGRSYHYYGFELLARDEWVRFLAKNLLLTPLADTRYIAHRILSGACTLRLTTAPLKPIEPRVVAVL